MPLSDTLARLPPAAADYARSILDHHWLEASWLYERREVLYTQGALLSADGWLELEARANAHVAALAKGRELVFEQCEDRALEGDVGELHTVIRLLARADRSDDFDQLVDRIDWLEPARAWAVTDALTWDAPDSWQELIDAMLVDEAFPDDAIGSLARVVGSRGWPLGETLLGVLEDRVGDLEAVAWAIGALGFGPALAELYAVIQEPVDAPVRRAAAIAALRFAPGEVLAFLERIVDSESWAAIPLALGGGPAVWPALSRVAKAEPTPERMLALGLFGYVGGIELLLEMVEDEECGGAAAEGLYLLTGAELDEEGYEGAEEDEGGAEKSGAEEDESGTGLLVRRLPQSRPVWLGWLDEHGTSLRGRIGTRVRMGLPAEPAASLEEISGVRVGLQARSWMVEELSVRYRLAVEAWPRMMRMVQGRGVRQGRARVAARPKLLKGEWYLAGQPVRGTRVIS